MIIINFNFNTQTIPKSPVRVPRRPHVATTARVEVAEPCDDLVPRVAFHHRQASAGGRYYDIYIFK